MEKHHLIPKSKGGKETIPVCIDCGNQLHKLFTLKQMKDKYHTVDILLSDERVQTWIKWIIKKTNYSITMKGKR